MSTSETTRTIRVDELARVEGEGALTMKIVDGRAVEVKFRIFEPPRFFEAFLRGRHQLEVPDITSRICGICPVAYITSACNAIENAHGIEVPPAIRAMRRLLYCGEWIESHGLHVFMLHAPDVLGYPDAIAMAKDHGDFVRRALRMKKTGNRLVSVVGGREVHPVNTRVGGFYKAPSAASLQALVPELEWSRTTALESLAFFAKQSFPDFERDYEFVALRAEGEYPIDRGRIVSNKSLDLTPEEFEANCIEEHVEHSTALHATLRDRGSYFCGPLARFNLAFDALPADLQQVAREAGIEPPCRNPYKSLLVRLIEIAYACGEALRIIAGYAPFDPPFVEIPTADATGYGVSEAPRGLLYHRYEVYDGGLVRSARIVPPTSQNQRTIEGDLFDLAPALAAMTDEDATRRAEYAVRNYDPCISCSTHFVKLTIE